MKYEETVYKIDHIGKLGVGVYTLSVAKAAGRWANFTLMIAAYDGDNEAPPHPASSVQVGVQPLELLAFTDEITNVLRPSRVKDDTVYLVRAWEDGPNDVRLCTNLEEVVRAYREFCLDGGVNVPTVSEEDQQFLVELNARLHNGDHWEDNGRYSEQVGEIAHFEVIKLQGWAGLVAGLNAL